MARKTVRGVAADWQSATIIREGSQRRSAETPLRGYGSGAGGYLRLSAFAAPRKSLPTGQYSGGQQQDGHEQDKAEVGEHIGEAQKP